MVYGEGPFQVIHIYVMNILAVNWASSNSIVLWAFFWNIVLQPTKMIGIIYMYTIYVFREYRRQDVKMKGLTILDQLNYYEN